MEGIANRFISRMLSEKMITEDEKELYLYVFITKIEQVITMSIILSASILFQVFFQTVMFLFFFFPVRKRAGGYHAGGFLQCLVSTAIIYILLVTVMHPLLLEHMEVTYLLLGVSVAVLEVIGAVKHPNINWDKKEYQASAALVRSIVALEAAIIVVTAFLGGDNSFIIFMVFGITLSASLLVIAKIIYRR